MGREAQNEHVTAATSKINSRTAPHLESELREEANNAHSIGVKNLISFGFTSFILFFYDFFSCEKKPRATLYEKYLFFIFFYIFYAKTHFYFTKGLLRLFSQKPLVFSIPYFILGVAMPKLTTKPYNSYNYEFL